MCHLPEATVIRESSCSPLVIRYGSDGQLLPQIMLSLPSVASVCSSVTIDLSSSTGHGGRSWTLIKMNVTVLDRSANVDVSTIQQLIDSALSSGQLYPKAHCKIVYTYVFTARLCNYLEGCAVVDKSLIVFTDSILIHR